MGSLVLLFHLCYLPSLTKTDQAVSVRGKYSAYLGRLRKMVDLLEYFAKR